MNVKIDTKERFSVINPKVSELTANMTVEISNLLLPYLQKDIPHIILKMTSILELDEQIANCLADLQQRFYENNCSFVICELQPKVEDKLNKLDLLEILNVTPTETEAWDIVQMEQIERELFDGED